jgi:hypothetical protein
MLPLTSRGELRLSFSFDVNQRPNGCKHGGQGKFDTLLKLAPLTNATFLNTHAVPPIYLPASSLYDENIDQKKAGMRQTTAFHSVPPCTGVHWSIFRPY